MHKMTFPAKCNPTDAEIRALIDGSQHKAARRIIHPDTGDVYVWPFEAGTHREGADALGIPYDRPPGEGDVLV